MRPITPADIQRKAIARDLFTDRRRLNAAVKNLDRQVQAAVAASGTTLTDIHGLGTITDARILALTADFGSPAAAAALPSRLMSDRRSGKSSCVMPSVVGMA